MFFIGQATSIAGDGRQERSKFHAPLGSRCPLQDEADFGLGAAAVLGGLDSDEPMYLIGQISYMSSPAWSCNIPAIGLDCAPVGLSIVKLHIVHIGFLPFSIFLHVFGD